MWKYREPCFVTDPGPVLSGQWPLTGDWRQPGRDQAVLSLKMAAAERLFPNNQNSKPNLQEIL